MLISIDADFMRIWNEMLCYKNCMHNKYTFKKCYFVLVRWLGDWRDHLSLNLLVSEMERKIVNKSAKNMSPKLKTMKGWKKFVWNSFTLHDGDSEFAFHKKFVHLIYLNSNCKKGK